MTTYYTDVKNIIWANQEHTAIICDVMFTFIPNEWTPFNANPLDVMPYSKTIFDRCVAGDYGTVAQYVPPPAPTTEQLAAAARSKRNTLLNETDWTQAGDVPQATKDLWAPYRQALRDVPDQSEFPLEIVWPVRPDALEQGGV